MDVTFHDDASRFLDEAGDVLAADPLSSSVVATVAERRRALPAPDAQPCWFAVVRDDEGQVVGVAMRTHPAPPHPGFVCAMPPGAVDTLAQALAGRGEVVTAWNGDLEAATRLCAAHGRPEVSVHLRLFEARAVVRPARPAGTMRAAVPGDLDLVLAWRQAFHDDAARQGGREPGGSIADERDRVLHDIEGGAYQLWEVEGRPVHLTCVQPPAFGVARIGPVYTPAADRGHGYAGWVVAEVTQRVLDAGNRACLYTDQANPVSNALYERIGYHRVQDEGEVVAR